MPTPEEILNGLKEIANNAGGNYRWKLAGGDLTRAVQAAGGTNATSSPALTPNPLSTHTPIMSGESPPSAPLGPDS